MMPMMGFLLTLFRTLEEFWCAVQKDLSLLGPFFHFALRNPLPWEGSNNNNKFIIIIIITSETGKQYYNY